MNDDLTLLASTYLDGEATPDERARVEADPALLGEVERLRTARTTLLDAQGFEGPGDGVRDTAIEAALTAWDVAATDMAASRADSRRAVRRPIVVSFERRRAYTRLLTAAAAVVAVGALGVVIAQSRGGDDDTSSLASEASADTAAAGQTDFAAATGQTEASPSDAERSLSGDVADDASGGATPDTEAFEQAPSAVAAAPEAPSATLPAAGADAVPQANLTTPEELGTFAADARAAVENDTNHDVLARPCSDATFDDIDTYVAMGTYRDRPVLIGIDDEDNRAIAVDPATCEIVAEAPLP